MVNIENLTKYYGKFMALDHANLHVDKGEIFGFVGPNGAGKTTTMRIMCGLLKATSGNVYIDGVDALKNPELLKSKIGYVPDFFGVYNNFRVMEYMEFYGSLYKMKKSEVDAISLGLLELVNLSDKKDDFVDSLSRGMKQRLCVARALIHNPDLLVLDEPNSGLDPRARFEMKEVLKNLGSMGKTIIISSHILPELSELCSSVGIIDHGKILASGKIEDIMRSGDSLPPIKIKAYLKGSDPVNSAHQIVGYVQELQNVDKISVIDDEIVIYYNGTPDSDAELLRSLVDRGVQVIQYFREKESLENLFLQVTGGAGNA
jgi:ABC-2 type transport system ATP-binding protein